MSVKAVVISSFASFLLGSDTFARIKGVVLRQDEKDLSGLEKRHAALTEIKTIGLGIAAWAVNLAIELSVAYLRTLSNKPESKQRETMVNKTSNKTKSTKRKDVEVVEKIVYVEKDTFIDNVTDGAKSIFMSKTFWVNIIAFVSVYLENTYGFGIDQGIQMQILTAVNIALRFVTKDKVVWRKPKPKQIEEEV